MEGVTEHGDRKIQPWRQENSFLVPVLLFSLESDFPALSFYSAMFKPSSPPTPPTHTSSYYPLDNVESTGHQSP